MAFSIPPVQRVPKSSWFDLSHRVATTLTWGNVTPVDWRVLEAGDIYKGSVSGFCRALATKAPLMQDIDLKFGTFFVPLRLLCTKAPEILSGSSFEASSHDLEVGGAIIGSDYGSDILPNMSKPSSLEFPYFIFNQKMAGKVISGSQNSNSPYSFYYDVFKVGSLADYLGFPACDKSTSSNVDQAAINGCLNGSVPNPGIPISLLPFKAYHLICNKYFTDEFSNMEMAQSGVLVNIDPEGYGLVSEQDLFTSVVNVGSDSYRGNSIPHFPELFGLRHSWYESDPFVKAGSSTRFGRINQASTLTGLSGEDISINANSIRSIFALDEYARKLESFFGDFKKRIKLMFGVITSDKSCMMPILVDSGSFPVQVSELNNLAATDSNPLGENGGKMMSSFGKQYNEFRAEEPGILMSVVWIRPKTCYMFGLDRDWEIRDANDMVNPLFAEVGECPINSREVSFMPFSGNGKYQGGVDPAVSRDWFTKKFGYSVGRYYWKKYAFDKVSADFRYNLSYWHCGRAFSDVPVINNKFKLINPDEDNKTLNRIFAITDGSSRPFQLQLRFNVQLRTCLPHLDGEM